MKLLTHTAVRYNKLQLTATHYNTGGARDDGGARQVVPNQVQVHILNLDTPRYSLYTYTLNVLISQLSS